jgi:hypothetical protein
MFEQNIKRLWQVPKGTHDNRPPRFGPPKTLERKAVLAEPSGGKKLLSIRKAPPGTTETALHKRVDSPEEFRRFLAVFERLPSTGFGKA